MGADYDGEKKAIAELRAMSPAARNWLSHHLRNSVAVITARLHLIETQQPGIYNALNLESAHDAAWHIVADLERIGC